MRTFPLIKVMLAGLFKLNSPSPHKTLYSGDRGELLVLRVKLPFSSLHASLRSHKGVSEAPTLCYFSIVKDATPLCFAVIRIHQIMALSAIYMHHPKKVQLSVDLSSPSPISTSLHIPESVPMSDISSTPETLPQCPPEHNYLSLSCGALLFFLV